MRTKAIDAIAYRSRFWPALLLAGITAVAFAPVLSHHFIEGWDDSSAILTNPDYNPPTFGKLVHYWAIPPKNTFYVPVTYTLWGVLAMISRSSAPPGLPFNPVYFYAANLVSHAISAALVFLILERLMAFDAGAAPAPPGHRTDRNGRTVAAWLGAAVFALHPLQVEGVAIASSVYTPLSGMFGFLAVWQYLLYAGQAGRRAGWHYGLASFAFVLALLTKPTAVAIPLVIAVIELFLRRRPLKSLLIGLGPWLGLSLLTIWLNEQSSPGATVFVPDAILRPLVPLDAIEFYIWKIFVPLHLALDYGRSPRWLVAHPLAWFTGLIPIAIFFFAWRARRRLPWLIASFGVFVAGLLPTIGIVPFDFQHFSTVADRYAYIAMLGPAMGVAFLVVRFGRVATGFAMVTLGILTMLSVVQLRYWRDDWQLMMHTLEVNPQSLSALGGFRYLFGQWPDTHHFPAPRSCTLDQPELVRLGDVMMSRRLWPLAAGAYRVGLSHGMPTAAIYDRLGEAELRDLDPQAAADAFTQALRLQAGDAMAQRGLAEARARLTVPDARHSGVQSTHEWQFRNAPLAHLTFGGNRQHRADRSEGFFHESQANGGVG